MPGQVLRGALLPGPLPARVAAYEKGSAAPSLATGDPAADPALLAHLRSLGYLGSLGSGSPGGASSPQGDQVLAALYLRGDRAAAIQALEEALKIEPGNALFRTNLERLRAGG